MTTLPVKSLPKLLQSQTMVINKGVSFRFGLTDDFAKGQYKLCSIVSNTGKWLGKVIKISSACKTVTLENTKDKTHHDFPLHQLHGMYMSFHIAPVDDGKNFAKRIEALHQAAEHR